MSGSLGNKKVMAENLDHYMKLNGVSRNKLSDDLNISYSTIRDWLKGLTYPRIDKIEMLADYFQIKKSDLVEDKNALVKDDILSIYSKLEKERKKRVYSFAEKELKEQNIFRNMTPDEAWNILHLYITEENALKKIAEIRKLGGGDELIEFAEEVLKDREDFSKHIS